MRISRLPLLAALAFAGCSRSDSAAPPPSASGHSTETIVAAYRAASRDGLYGAHLKPLVHAELVASAAQSWMLADRPDRAKPDAPPPAHELRDILEGELDQLEEHFDFPVTPTKALEFTQTLSAEGSSEMTSRVPLFLSGGEGDYAIVFGLPKSPEAVEAARSRERLRFSRESGLWKQRWELRMKPDADAAYTLELIDAANGEVIETLSGPAPLKPPAGRAVNFYLQAEGMDAAFERNLQGAWRVSYAYQAGPSATAAGFDLPLSAVGAYTPNRAPSLVGDMVTLATFDGERDGAPRSVAVVLRRRN